MGPVDLDGAIGGPAPEAGAVTLVTAAQQSDSPQDSQAGRRLEIESLRARVVASDRELKKYETSADEAESSLRFADRRLTAGENEVRRLEKQLTAARR